MLSVPIPRSMPELCALETRSYKTAILSTPSDIKVRQVKGRVMHKQNKTDSN